MMSKYSLGDTVHVHKIDVNVVSGTDWTRAALLALVGCTGTVVKVDGLYLHVEFERTSPHKPTGIYRLHQAHVRPAVVGESDTAAAYINSLQDQIQGLLGGRARANIELAMIDDILTGNESGYMYDYWTSLHDRVQAYVNMNGSKTALLALHKIKQNHPEIVQALLDADETIDIEEITSRFPLPTEGKGN